MTDLLETRCLSSLTKVFADEELTAEPYSAGSALKKETYSFQVAYRAALLIKSVEVNASSPINARISLRAVGLAPSELPYLQNSDEHVLRKTPGLFPDPLYPIHPEDGIAALPGQWRSVWVTVEPDRDVKPGKYDIHILFQNAEGKLIGSETFELDIVGASLPKQQLIHTEWLHTDCLATYYGLDVFSEPHWQMIERYIETAVRHGINMTLTPLFTPPLDTAIGGERPTVQLIDVEKHGDSYHFSFGKLKRWVEMCNRLGVEYFEFSHLFTQWGAKHAPKIMAEEDGVRRKIFGWETDAGGPEYLGFLGQFLPELVKFTRQHGLEKRCYFHNSDEPRGGDLEQYQKLSRFTRQYLDPYPIIDALSDYSFYEQGAVKIPVPASNHIEPFIEHQVRPLWTYYCVSQRVNTSNRFFNIPSARNRIIGIQLYKFDAAGFLHWGYNFWYSQYSKRPLNPFVQTDASHAFPSGDAFLVYPGAGGPIESLRMEVFYEALQDLRALRLLESFIGREEVMALLEGDLQTPITFSEYPRSEAWLLAKREQINRLIAANHSRFCEASAEQRTETAAGGV
ncbi:DUF4091 domain-containing protein [Paenibacillus thalictri]|uniref:DUF4091 domain-containing protein n=1 Tax=Paenibacillus thalictri TaxID=2527873 RepID=A0A4Q9DQ40_9BACL|nr:DUF4091 domain-containing protein [Paenibacillus thalictri]TBL78503.1 DUF4091 domain-containing protein [Paenibacillus thalictri]